MAKKQHDHGFEMMAIVGIVAVVGLIIMFMNTGNLSGEASREMRVTEVEQYSPISCVDVKCTPYSNHACCNIQVSDPCGGESTLYCGSGDHTWPAYCTVVNDVAVYGCTQ